MPQSITKLLALREKLEAIEEPDKQVILLGLNGRSTKTTRARLIREAADRYVTIEFVKTAWNHQIVRMNGRVMGRAFETEEWLQGYLKKG